MKYTVDYFIQKFEAIPEDNWITEKYSNDLGCCALGWCGEKSFHYTDESRALDNLFYNEFRVGPSRINDKGYAAYQQPNPKARVLAALYDIKNAHAHTLPKGE